MKRYRTVRIDTTASTNTYAKSLTAPDTGEGDVPTVVITDNQTEGRGQRGNTWHSEPGMNLTFSLVVYPSWMSAARQFELSMLVALGLVETLRQYIDEEHHPEWLKIKWPNDIYYGDRKIAGILIENVIGENAIERSVIGIGLNVNQTRFARELPNPVSLREITGHETDLAKLLETTVDTILDNIDNYETDPEIDELTAVYNSLLWRADNAFHNWQLPDSAETIRARLVKVDCDGRLHLEMTDGTQKTFLFKEIIAVI